MKLYHKPDCVSFDSFGRVMSGTLRVGDTVRPQQILPPAGLRAG